MIACAVCILWPIPQRPVFDSDPRRITPGDLCDRAFESREFGYRARVPFRRLTPTIDPRIFEYRGGTPAKFFPPLVRVAFADVPAAVPNRPVIVGIVSGIDPDDLPRASRHLGIVVISGAYLVQPDAP
jgi:hypothetical protein